MDARSLIATALIATLVSACSFRQITADSTADLLHATSPQFNSLEDLDFAESAVPASLVTMESVWRATPDNPDVLIELVQGYTGYGFGFMEDHMEQAAADGDDAASDHFRARAKAAYRRARMFGFHLMNVRHPTDGGPEARVRAGIEPFRAYLAKFDSRDDVPVLYWTANAWASRVALSLDEADAMLDLPFALAIMERARALDPEFYYGGIHAFYGAYLSGMPEMYGGRPAVARQEFEAALRRTERHLLIYQVLFARTYAVQVQDRALFRALLEEVLAAGDVMPEERLTNQIARRRAQRYLAQIDELFQPSPTPEPPAEPSHP